MGHSCSCSRLPLIDVEGRHIATGCGLRGVRQSTSRSIIQSLFYICHYSHAPCIFENRNVLRAVHENKGLRPDLTVTNAPNYNAPLLVDVSVVQAFPGSKTPLLRFHTSLRIFIPHSPLHIEPLIVLTTTKSININAFVTTMEFHFYLSSWDLTAVSYTHLTLPTIYSV